MSIWKEAVRTFREKVLEKYGENIVAVILFGSAARGELDEESDIDVLVVLRDYKDFWKEFHTISDMAYDVSMGTDFQVLISPILVTQQEYEESRGILLRNIKREGVFV
jgi:predicted nucleotidyltransferase